MRDNLSCVNHQLGHSIIYLYADAHERRHCLEYVEQSLLVTALACIFTSSTDLGVS